MRLGTHHVVSGRQSTVVYVRSHGRFSPFVSLCLVSATRLCLLICRNEFFQDSELADTGNEARRRGLLAINLDHRVFNGH